VGSDTLGITTSADPGEPLLMRLVMEDDTHEPWMQSWELPHPGRGRRQSLAWQLEADADGELTLRLHPAEGEVAELTGTLHRTAAAGDPARPAAPGGAPYPRITPGALRKALEAITPTADD
jgi:hypothetical protein